MKYHTAMMYGLMEVKLHSLLTLIVDWGEWLASHPGRFTPREKPGTHWIGDGVIPRTCVDVVAKRIPLPFQERNPVCPSCILVTILSDVSWIVKGIYRSTF
jgi:hypothetical protein